MSDDSPYYQRNSTFTFSDAVNFPRNFFTLYSAPNDSYIAFQMFAETINGLPAAPNITLRQTVEDQNIYKPDGNLYSSVGVCLSQSAAFAVINSGFGLGLVTLGVNPDSTQTEMKLIDWNWMYWTDGILSTGNGFPEDSVNNELTSIAVSHPDTKQILAVVLTNSVQGIFRLLLVDVVSATGYQSSSVISSPDNVFTARPVVAAYTDAGINTYILAYSWKISKFSYEILVQTIDDIMTVTNVTSIPWSTSYKPIDVQLTYIGNNVIVLTYQLINETHSTVKQHVISIPAKGTISLTDLAAIEDLSVTYAIATNAMPDGRLVTTWASSSNTSSFNGVINDYNNKTVQPLAFTIPAADPALPIARLQIAPLSSTSFAVTQMRVGPRSSSFTNYYIISSCDDGQRTMNENCEQGNVGCENCMCNNGAGYYATNDGITCETTCGDNIVAGTESCDNSNDVNCVNCACVQGSTWNSTAQLCTLNIIATPSNEQAGSPGSGGWSNDYIAIFVVCPIGIGAAIFLAVYFGKKRKARKEAKQKAKQLGSLPDSSSSNYPRVPGTYGSIPANQVELEPTSFNRANSALKNSQAVDKLNVPYSELKFLTEIGAGAYGKVFIGEWQRVKVALKINTSATGSDFEREAKLMVELRPHPNVVQMLGVSSDGPYPVMILEYCDGGSLDTKLFDMNQVWTVAEQLRTVNGIAKGLFHLHKNQIIHRDISARNILLNFNQPKISDFGLSRLVSDTKKGSTTKSNVGPIRWMSPESLKTMSYSTKSDVWTFGLVIYEIVARKEPHADADQIAIGLQIRDQGVTPEIPQGCDPCLKEVMLKCWQLEPDNRPTMEQICDILDKYMETNKFK